MKKILFICEEIPCENSKGYLTYNHAFIKSLSEQGHQVCLIVTGNTFSSFLIRPSKILCIKNINVTLNHAFKINNDFFIINFLSLLKLIYSKVFFVKNIIKKINRKVLNSNVQTASIGRWLNRTDNKLLSKLIQKQSPEIVFVDTIFRTPDFFNNKTKFKKVLIGHDVFFERCISFKNNGIKAIPNVDIEIESDIVRNFDAVIAITNKDEITYKKMIPQAYVLTLSSPIVQIKNRKQVISNTLRCIYIGSNAHHNVDGLNWFIDEIWPLVIFENPDLKLDIVGDIARSFNCNIKGITFHGKVEDLNPIANQAMFAINPVRMGSGMKIKVLEYLKYGLPCITTKLGAAGFKMDRNSPLIIFDDAKEFAVMMIHLSNSVNKCTELSSYAADFIDGFSKENFNLELHDLTVNIL